jgi:hypothetical protein
VTLDEIRDARAHFSGLAETCEQEAREFRDQAEQLGVEETSIVLLPTAAILEREARWARAAVDGLDALERELKGARP